MPTLQIEIPKELNASLESIPDINAFAKEALAVKLREDANSNGPARQIVADAYREAEELREVSDELLKTEIRELHGKVLGCSK